MVQQATVRILELLELRRWKSIYIWCSVCFDQINVKSAEPIGPKFCLRPYMTPGNVYDPSKFKKKNPGKKYFYVAENAPIRIEKSANWVFATSSNYRTLFSLKPNVKLGLFGVTELNFEIWKIYDIGLNRQRDFNFEFVARNHFISEWLKMADFQGNR